MHRRAMILALASPSLAMQPEEPQPDLEAFDIETLEARRAESGRTYLPFLRRDTLHCGIYVLEAGATDGQRPHDEDEVYYVLEGKGKFTVESETVDAEKGGVLFVAAQAGHRFHDIEEDLKLLVFFSRAKPKP